MIDQLAELLQREAKALERIAARLRALELVVAVEEQRLFSLALEELEGASEQLAGLELARVLAFSATVHGPDVTAERLIASDRTEEQHLARAAEALRTAMSGASDARDRVVALVSRRGRGDQHRSDPAGTGVRGGSPLDAHEPSGGTHLRNDTSDGGSALASAWTVAS